MANIEKKDLKKLFLISLALFLSCINKENQPVTIDNNKIINDLPIGKDLLISNQLPDKIIFNYDDNGNSAITNNNLLDSVSSISGNYYDELQINKKINFNILPQIKKDIVYNKAAKSGMINYLDSCYYAKTIYSDNKIKLKLFKDGGKYKSKLGYENTSITNYLILAIYNNSDKLISYKVMYLNELFQYGNHQRCFYLDKKLNLYLKDYSTDEEKMYLLLSENLQIQPDGKILQVSINKNSISKNDHDKIDSSENLPVGSWRDDCNINYRYFQVEKTGNVAILAMEPNNYYINLKEIKEKRLNGKFFYKIDNVEGIGTEDAFSEDFKNDKEVIIVQIIDSNSIEFKWLGYYDNSSKKRISNECPFGRNSCDEKPIILKKCE